MGYQRWVSNNSVWTTDNWNFIFLPALENLGVDLVNLWALKLDRKWLLLDKLRIIRLFHILFWWQLFDFCFLSFLFFRYSSVILSHIYLRKTPTTLKTLLKYRTNSFCNFQSHISEFFVIQSLKDEIQITERWDKNHWEMR